jgi:predicted transcriptional regulator
MANPGTETAETDDERARRVMHIRFGTGNTEHVEETLAALDRGENPPPYLERVYRDVDNLHRVTRPKNLELLRVLATECPESIRETARLVDRDVRQVHRNLEELEALDLIEFQSDGPGKPKRPIVWYDEIAVELPLVTEDGTGEDRAEA